MLYFYDVKEEYTKTKIFNTFPAARCVFVFFFNCDAKQSS